MPYITSDEYKQVQHLLAPSADLPVLEQQLFELNRQIKANPAEGPSASWRALVMSHGRILQAYRAAGGTRL